MREQRKLVGGWMRCRRSQASETANLPPEESLTGWAKSITASAFSMRTLAGVFDDTFTAGFGAGKVSWANVSVPSATLISASRRPVAIFCE